MRRSKPIEINPWCSHFDGPQVQLKMTVISMEDAVYQLKCQHGTVILTDDAVNQSQCQSSTIIMMNDAVNQSKYIHTYFNATT